MLTKLLHSNELCGSMTSHEMTSHMTSHGHHSQGDDAQPLIFKIQHQLASKLSQRLSTCLIIAMSTIYI